MTTINAAELREAVRGEVIDPEHPSYDEARKVYNGMHDRRPEVIVRCVDAADVQAAVRAAAESGAEVAVRGGGHSAPGFGTIDGGLVIDTSPMRLTRVDPAARTARVGGGATWGDFDHATHPFGLATTGGIISTTGVAGLTLGGGIGYLTRGSGLSCDNLLSADVVTADGRIVTASAEENEDLYWALRGGSGNFGVVTSLEFRMHPVETIYGGVIFYELDAAPGIMHFYREFIADAPRELGGFFAYQMAPPLPFIPEDRHLETLCLIAACWSGDTSEGESVLKPLYEAGPVVATMIEAMPYPALNSAFDALLPPGLQHYWKADFARELTDDAIAAHARYGPLMPALQSTMHLYPINGAVHDVGTQDSAWAHRDLEFACVIAGMWPDPADNDANIRWVRDYYAAVHPYAGVEGGYVNFMGPDDADKAPENYGANYERLRRVKAEWDPTNLFHWNQNIRPAGS